MYGVLIVDDDTEIQERLKRMLEDSEFVITNKHNSMHEPKPTSFTPDRECGWYRQFEKRAKKRNF